MTKQLWLGRVVLEASGEVQLQVVKSKIKDPVSYLMWIRWVLSVCI